MCTLHMHVRGGHMHVHVGHVHVIAYVACGFFFNFSIFFTRIQSAPSPPQLNMYVPSLLSKCNFQSGLEQSDAICHPAPSLILNEDSNKD